MTSVTTDDTTTDDATAPAWVGIVIDTLKANQVEIVPYVPDKVLAPLIRRLQQRGRRNGWRDPRKPFGQRSFDRKTIPFQHGGRGDDGKRGGGDFDEGFDNDSPF